MIWAHFSQRGEHDIENEMVFESNPGFVFHDSCGFEAGGVDEFQKVKMFVQTKSRERSLAKQIHAIWLVGVQKKNLVNSSYATGTAFQWIAPGHLQKQRKTFLPLVGLEKVSEW